jgi:hypothetical protein
MDASLKRSVPRNGSWAAVAPMGGVNAELSMTPPGQLVAWSSAAVME